ncbi:MAG: hypothetical protein AAF772_10525 [Acidobacteriota bacterium]
MALRLLDGVHQIVVGTIDAQRSQQRDAVGGIEIFQIDAVRLRVDVRVEITNRHARREQAEMTRSVAVGCGERAQDHAQRGIFQVPGPRVPFAVLQRFDAVEQEQRRLLANEIRQALRALNRGARFRR